MVDNCTRGHDRDVVGWYEWQRLNNKGEPVRQRRCMQCQRDGGRQASKLRVARHKAASSGIVPIIEAVKDGLSADARLEMLVASEIMPKWQQMEVRHQLLDGRGGAWHGAAGQGRAGQGTAGLGVAGLSKARFLQ